MSQYNKTVLTNAGLELAKRANAGQAKFEITRAVTSADDWSNKTVQDIEAVTAIPNIMQQGTIMDTEEVESNNSVMGVSLCFANKDLSTGYQIRIIGLYVKEEGQENDFLYAVTTAVTPEFMPDFSDGVLYRFNMQMYLVIGKAQAVNVVINDGASVTHRQFDNYKNEVTANLEKIKNAHKEDMSHVVKSASINGGSEVLPDETGKLELVVPDPDLSKYVNIDDLKEMLNTKANTSDVYAKSDVDSALAAGRGRLGKLEGAQTVDSPDFNTITATGVYYITNNTPANIKNNPASQWGVLVVSSGNGQRISQVYYPDDGSPQWCRLLNGSNWLPWYQLSTKKDVSDATNAANAASSKVDTALGNSYFKKQGIDGNGDLANIYAYATKQSNGGYVFDAYTSDLTAYYLHDLMGQLPSKANSADVYTKTEVDGKTSGTVVTAYDIASKTPTTATNSYTSEELVDQLALSQFADQINQLKGRQTVDAPDFNTLTDSGVYMVTSPSKGKNYPSTISNGTLTVFNSDSTRIVQIYFSDSGKDVFKRIGWLTGTPSWGIWSQIAWTSDITNLQNQITPLQTQLSDAVNEINYLKTNMLIGKHFTDEASAQTWANANPNGIAFIDK